MESERRLLAQLGPELDADLVLRLVADVYSVAPYHLIAYLFCKFAHGLQEVFLLAFSDKLLRTVCIP